MKLGVFTVLFSDRQLEEALDTAQAAGLQAVEIGTGGYVGKAHLAPSELLQDKDAIERIKRLTTERGLTISALSCHGNPLHPNKEKAESDHRDFRDTVKLAALLGVDTVITFSGCPGDSEHSLYPSWVTCPWPPDFLQVLEWQWTNKVIPYWRDQSDYCRQYGVRVAIEAHPGFVVYNTETALRLRREAGDNIGVNFDPSHLFWQGMDPVECIKVLGSSIYHMHAKDTSIDSRNTALNGVLDVKPYSNELERSWIFRTIGYGTDEKVWKNIISTLRKAGYDGVISIEHEDSLMSVEEGLSKAVHFLNKIMIGDKAGEMWWA
ncbi:sugar phosphate isomerase/epimerase family protein [Paenibacillus macquariensis]|uniref:Sugar phosphate isomerase/epimerase n=1 Tax=Paenibacillus macquariensis TaxID=948756 RepID=A0ABY1K7Z1_9BACL|nr:sugar phosphate isomerase/epimerase [Paenibacillus macquariensis]MEC0091165.1 sugar phosphate isomerase/epimerase [Paenibacillus macquariensis]OAB33652.1 xylose isomerase [Paenibacillus macquariensis subsp. macquariensis]SIR38459.1 Sugar phosphate isomerase/epimerase [Paenibacillus macquariensis]